MDNKVNVEFKKNLKIKCFCGRNLNSYYSISLDKKKSKWRLMIQMLDKDGNIVFPTENEKDFLQGIKKIRIKELSEHYGEY